MADFIDDFIESLNRRETTKETYRKALREFSKWLGGASPIGLTSKDIEKYKEYIISKNLSPTSMSAYLTAVRRLYEYLLSEGRVSENPAKKVKGSSRPRRHLTEPLTRVEVHSLFSAIDTSSEIGVRDVAMLSLMARSGLSEIEIIRANLGDINNRGGKTVIYVQGKNKDKKDEYVILTPEVKHALDKYISQRDSFKESDPLFWGIGNRAKNLRVTTRGIRARVNHYFELSGIKRKGITPYSLRHTAAILAIEDGATVTEVKQMLRLKTVDAALVYFEEAREKRNKSIK
jgi:integrase/recombinase XerC/integrase/recombinase XerD